MQFCGQFRGCVEEDEHSGQRGAQIRQTLLYRNSCEIWSTEKFSRSSGGVAPHSQEKSIASKI